MKLIVMIGRGAGAVAMVASLTGSLAACTGAELTRNFGLTRDVPDEFQVTTRAPLSMPPDFTLRPPEPGAPRPQELTQSAAAEAALVPGLAIAAPDATAITPGQQAFLAASGAPAPADTRARVAGEVGTEPSNRSLTDRLMFWKRPVAPGVAVDPAREADRLRENAALGQNVQTGDTPVIQRSPKGLLDSIF